MITKKGDAMSKLNKYNFSIKSREEMANPWAGIPLIDRLIATKAVDFRDNCRIIDLGNGYGKVEAIDKTKIFKPGDKL